ncbi:PEP/pyruvate-binding domain-containing protein [Ruania halotolerans]|uniref:PEP/pyruvate-binding domain-containing protein n=1 Tax=Ruania halotolerans TaxID=2897773 RepID=UPI001E5A716A|nr:PEP/pyruvate-binding domain-containing protein [Ruania halotolerans]UFU07920.1 pyruvate, phosphate dikinase [Ruania halotolerans]
MDLIDADHSTAGGKAAPLAELTRAGFTVPTGFVVPATIYRVAATALGLTELSTEHADEARSRILRSRLPDGVVDDVSQALERITAGAPTDYVAVRSSSTAEDNAHASAAGQHDSFLAVRGTEQVCQAILKCWASLWTERAAAYRAHQAPQAPQPPGDMAVLVQRFVDARVSGVMFTGTTSVIEASWGIGERLVAGHITPDSWRIRDSEIVDRRPGLTTERTDRYDVHLLTRFTVPTEQPELCLADHDVMRLYALGEEISTTLGGPRDIEWALADDTAWVLQARPVTAAVPDSTAPSPAAADSVTITGVPASPGVASGPARLVRGPGDFSTVKRGDVLVCRHTDPAWTPLFTIASAVVTEIGGVLSHAAIVAREVGIPAVLSVPRATERLPPSSVVTVDGTTGHVSL